MDWIVLVSTLGLIGLAVGAAATPPEGPEGPVPLAGWFGVFPEVPNYHRTFLGPVVGGEPPGSYRQTARYDWMGGRFEVVWVTPARDPGLRPEATGAAEVAVAGRRAWAAGPDRLVVALAADKALLVQRDGAGPDLREFLRGFDLAALEQALDRPPRIDFRRNADAFRVLHAGAAYSEVVAWVGFGDEHVGRDGHVLVYHLPEGGRVLLTFRDSEGLAAARLERADGRGEALIPEA